MRLSLMGECMGEDRGIGNFTTTYNTVIDYVIATWNVVKFVKGFKLLDFRCTLWFACLLGVFGCGKQGTRGW